MTAVAPEPSPRRPRTRPSLVFGLGMLAIVVAAAFAAYAVIKAQRVTPGGSTVTPPASSRLALGDKAPLDFTLASLRGRTRVDLAVAGAGHPVVLNLFASWCNACAAELSAFASISRRYAGRVTFIGVDTNDHDPNLARSLLRHAGAAYPVVVDTADLGVATAYGVSNLPVTFFLDAQGRIVDEVLGQQTTRTLGSRVAALTAGRLRA